MAFFRTGMGKMDSSYNWTKGGFQLEKDLGPHWENWDDLERDIRSWAQKDYILLRCVASKRADIYNNKRGKPFVKGHKSYIDPVLTEFAYGGICGKRYEVTQMLFSTMAEHCDADEPGTERGSNFRV